MNKEIKSFGAEQISQYIHLDMFSVFTIEAGSDNLIESIVSPRRLTGSVLGICLQGSGELMIDSDIYHISEQDMFVIFSQAIFQPISFSKDIKLFIFGINPEFFTNLDLGALLSYFLYIKEHPCISLNDEEMHMICELCKLIQIKSQRENHIFIKEVAEKMMLTLCYEICNIYSARKPVEQQKGKRKERLLADFLYLLNQHYNESRTLEFYASKLCVTSKYLYQVIKETSGHSPSVWIAYAVILNAKALLKSDNLSISQISDMLNFPNPSFFTQYFKKHTGITPKKFRGV